MVYKEFLIEVAKHADTAKSAISAAEVNRVISEAFKVLVKQDAATAAELFAKGLALAKKKL